MWEGLGLISPEVQQALPKEDVVVQYGRTSKFIRTRLILFCLKRMCRLCLGNRKWGHQKQPDEIANIFAASICTSPSKVEPAKVRRLDPIWAKPATVPIYWVSDCYRSDKHCYTRMSPKKETTLLDKQILGVIQVGLDTELVDILWGEIRC